MYALKQVPSEKICIEKESITDGILELISELGIQKLVMGAGSNSRFLRIKPKPTSEQSNEVLNKAPDFCHIWFVYKGRLIYTRKFEDRRVVKFTMEDLSRNDKWAWRNFGNG
ncbi:U-box domain-containing protein 33-like [Spinacia oleracea]|uniref:RING-type E3 ubiquitin transferase n=1 Tax=Spinacia oleracea TaxID=3562 RepID=A0ABM3R535_SPIOL|nr:U-box domain-containing protein 33-like [Spinacia oleracea]